MSDPTLESTRRRLTARQADTVDRLGRAALELLRRDGFAGLTVRRVAAEAGVGAATAYTYFSSKEHLVAEVFWRRLTSSPCVEHASADQATRVTEVLAHIRQAARAGYYANTIRIVKHRIWMRDEVLIALTNTSDDKAVV